MTKDTCDPGSRRGRTFICQARTAAGKIRSFLHASLTPVPPWRDSGRNRFLILLVRACCALYFSLVLLLSVYRRISLWWTPVLFAFFFVLLTVCDRLLPETGPSFREHRRTWLWGAGFGFAAFLILLGFFFTCGVSADVDIRAALHSFNEGDYNDWHPFLHTLFLAGCLKIHDSISCIVLVQGILFCCAFGCLAGILFQSGLPKYLSVPVLLYPLVSPQTHVFMMGCMKDSTLAVVMMPVCCCMIKIYLSGGEWLERRSRLIFFAVTLAAATLLRHNAFFFTLPCLALLFVPAGVKRTLQCAGIFLLLIVLVKGPLYRWFGVRQDLPRVMTAEQRFFLEGNGLPLSVLGAIYVNSPEAVPERTRQLLEQIAPREAWLEKFQGHFNSVKFERGPELHRIAVPAGKDFYADLLRAVRADRETAIVCFKNVTGLVWDPAVPHDRVLQSTSMWDMHKPVRESGA